MFFSSLDGIDVQNSLHGHHGETEGALALRSTDPKLAQRRFPNNRLLGVTTFQKKVAGVPGFLRTLHGLV
jgi:hypothetical protein